MALPPLINMTYAQSNPLLAPLAITNQPELEDIILAATNKVRKYCRRNFNQQSYTKYFVGGSYPFDLLMVNECPIIQVTRLATSPKVVLNVSNTSQNNQRATVATTAAGITLFSVASGVPTTNNAITFGQYPTVQAIANAIIAIGNGWSAVPVPGYALFPSADFKIIQGALSCAVSQTNGSGPGAGLEMFLEQPAFGGYGSLQGWINDGYCGGTQWRMDPDKGVIAGQFPQARDGAVNIRVDYVGGFTEVPDAVQRATLLVCVAIFTAGKINPNLKSERALDYAYELAAKQTIMPAGAISLLSEYVDRAASHV